jgi:hypothetical protein
MWLERHLSSTGQKRALSVVQRIWELGQGHPWLTNAMADQIVRRDMRDRNVTITAAHVDAAKETLILERRTHLAFRDKSHPAVPKEQAERAPRLMTTSVGLRIRMTFPSRIARSSCRASQLGHDRRQVHSRRALYKHLCQVGRHGAAQQCGGARDPG